MADENHTATAAERATLEWLRSVHRPYLTSKFWPRVDMSAGRGGCWPWAGGQTSNGYGLMSVTSPSGKRNIRAHQIAYFLANDDVEVSRWVLHSCDNRPCCNPAHLRGGTRAENSADMVARARLLNRPKVYGERHHATFLTDGEVGEIRSLARSGVLLHREIGARFGLAQASVSKIISGESWPHLNEKYPPTPRSQTRQVVLTFAKATEIRRLYSGGDVTLTDLAERFGAPRDTISEVLRNRSWRDPEWTPPAETPRQAMDRRKAEAAREFAERARPHIEAAITAGATTDRAIAATLRQAGLRMATGGNWHHERVRQIRARFGIQTRPMLALD